MINHKNNYVMIGDPVKKELKTYHLIVAVSYDCNLHCKHCYNEDGREKNSHLSLGDYKNMVDEWSKIVLSEREKYGGIIHFKGGEPFVYGGFNELLQYSSGKGLKVFITTNGTTVTEGYYETSKQVHKKTEGNLKLILSLNGSTPEIDEILREKGAFDKTIKLAKKLSKDGISFDINYVVHSGNQQDIKSAIHLARKLRVEQFNLLPLVLKGNATKYGIEKADQERLLKDLDEIYTSGDEEIKQMLEGSIVDVVAKTSQGCYKCASCTAGYKGLLYILPNGDIYSCPNTVLPKLKAGNVKNISLKDAMKGGVFEKLKSSMSVDKSSFDGICKGEELLYKNDSYNSGELIKRLEAVQALILKKRKATQETKSHYASTGTIDPKMSLCINRNW